MNYTFTVPPTLEQGSYKGTCSPSARETYRQNALIDYNSARAHDNLPPLSRMPRGTRYTPVRTWYIQRAGQGQVETVDQFDDRKEAKKMRAEYALSDRTAGFYLSTRPCKGWND